MYPQSMFWAKIRKNVISFHLYIIISTAVKYCSILHRRVCVMRGSNLHVFKHDAFENHEVILAFLIITKTCPCNMQQFLLAVKNDHF